MDADLTHPVERAAGYKIVTLLGGAAGLIGFLAVGLLPSLVCGGWAGVTLAATLFGTPIDTSWLARGVLIVSMGVELLATAAGFVILGAALGAGTYSLLQAFGFAK